MNIKVCRVKCKEKGLVKNEKNINYKKSMDNRFEAYQVKGKLINKNILNQKES